MSVYRGVKTGCSMGGAVYKKVRCTQCEFYKRIPNTFNPHRKSKTVPYCTKKVSGSKCGWRLCSQYMPKAKKSQKLQKFVKANCSQMGVLYGKTKR